MSDLFSKSLSPQAAAIYKLLNRGKSLSAKDIGKKLCIFPNGVYRATRQLIEMGLVEPLPEYPVRFRAKSADDAIAVYTSLIRQSFSETFGGRISKGSGFAATPLLPLEFIHTRTQLLGMDAKDGRTTKYSMSLIVSGLEVPAETILSYKRVVERGVRLRLIVQNMDEVRAEMFRNWQRIGAEVRYYPKIEARIFIFDHRIVYITSYNPKHKEEAIGMRFDYPPLAALMDELFERRWKAAKLINPT